MKLRLTTDKLADYTARQLESFFPDGNTVTGATLSEHLPEALDRVEYCFRHIAWAGFSEDGQAKFDVLHSDQYCSYLYYLSNTVYRRGGDPALAGKLFYLNKTLHAFNCMYDTELPDIFWPIHVVGTVLGKAKYANYFAVLQNCTIGAIGGKYPEMSEGLILSAGASIVGECRIGRNVMIAPGVCVTKQNIPDDTLVTAETELALRPNANRALAALFKVGP